MKTIENYIHLYPLFLAALAFLFFVIWVWGKFQRKRQEHDRFVHMNRRAFKKLQETLPDDIGERPTGIGQSRTQ